jgi:hypothetical protein
MDSKREKYKREAKAVMEAIKSLTDECYARSGINMKSSSNFKLIMKILSDFEDVDTNASFDTAQFCKDIKKLAEIISPIPKLTYHSNTLFGFYAFMAREGGFFKKDKDQGSHGIPCMNMRTGLIYIS